MRARILRSQREEILDQEGHSPRGQAIMHDLDRWNRVAGWTRRHVAAVERWWRVLGEPRPFRVLDVGTGPGTLLQAIGAHFDRLGVQTELCGLDLNPGYTAMARERLGERATILEGDATNLPFEDRAFDLGTSALMVHHLPPPLRPRVVSELGRVCRAAYVFDLEISFTGVLGWAALGRLLRMSPDTVHDGVLSVRRACTHDEFATLVAPLRGRVVRRFPTGLATLPA